MSGLEARRTNKRLEAIASVLFNLGAALVGAVGVRLYTNVALDWALVIWSFGAAMLIWTGWMVLGLIESED